ncbi:hypothetical protein BN14_01534 [Rhizoctonia solani AG-1 IB]|uniref:Uncharacterized protein n=1 Tax=Thanatephorus cucumeris (strain AG1-IB / isolate 7/3/14) TaxID=1108050 RepID=M5BUY6_THACB|nr:hypothetical protein BN14_01534 [Rhizoctonia solani AG-1 IB]
MRRIVSALGLSKDRQHDRRRAAADVSRSRSLRCESTPALVHIPDSSSSSGIRTPSDVDAPDMLAVPTIVNPSASSDSVAHSVRSAPAPSRWVGLLRTLSRKKHSDPAPPVVVADDVSDDSHSIHSDRPRSPPVLLPPPTPHFASNGRQMSSPANSIYRAGLAHVQRRAPPSRANLALQEFTKSLVMATGAPTPHPLRAPDASSPQSYPRSVSHAHVPSQSLCIQLHRARILQRLEEGALTPAEEASIAPFAVRPPVPRSLRKTRASPNDEWVAHLELGARTGRWSRGLRRWVARPVFEDRIQVHTPSGIHIVQPARGLGTETLDFSDGTLAMAGLAIDTETDHTDDDYGDPMAQYNVNAPFGASSAEPRTLSKQKPPIVRGVRFADDEDATDGDDLPLAVLASVQKKRAEREARARHARYVEDSADPKRRSYAEEYARSRALQGNARAGLERPASFVRDSDTRRMTLPSSGLVPVKESGHRRSGSGGTTSSGSHKRRSTVGEGMMEQVISPTRSVFASSSSSSAPNTALPSPVSPFAGLPRSLPSSARASPAPLPSPSLPFAGRSMTGSPLRSSFALGMNQDEFGNMLAAAQNQQSTRALIAHNQALMAQNQMLASMMMGQSMSMDLGLPNPPFAHSGGSSASGSRGRSPARSSGGSQSSSRRPGPSPVQASANRTSAPVGSVPRTRNESTTQRGRQEARATSTSRQDASRSRPRGEDTRPKDSRPGPGHSKSASQSTSRTRPGHAHSRSDHSIAGQRVSRLGMGSMAPPMPNVPTGVYSMRGRPRPSEQVVS